MALQKFTNLTEIKGQGRLNGHLGKNSFIDGATPSTADIDLFNAFPEAPQDRFANISRWYKFVASFTDEERAAWRAEGAEADVPPEPVAPVVAEEDDDDFDFFGSDDDEEAMAELAAARVKPKDNKKLERSNVCIAVNPTGVDVDWGEIEDYCRSITIEGLDWKAAVLEDVAFGIKKLKISMNIIDDLVSVDDVEELIQANEDVTSTEIVHFTKL